MEVAARIKPVRDRKKTVPLSAELLAAYQARRLTSHEVPIMKALLLGEQIHINEVETTYGHSIDRGVKIVPTTQTRSSADFDLITRVRKIIRANQAPFTLASLWKRAFQKRPEFLAPLRTKELEDVIEALMASIAKGDIETVRLALAPVGLRISSWPALYTSKFDPENRGMLIADLPKVLGWFGQHISEERIALLTATAIARHDSAEVLSKVSGLLPGEPTEDRLASAQSLVRYLRATTRDELRITVDEVSANYTLIPSSSGLLAFVTTGELVRYFSDGTTRPYGAIRTSLTLSTGHTTDVVVSSARYSRALATLEHELSHITTRLVRNAIYPYDLRKESREAAYLDELCAQLSDRFRPLASIRHTMSATYAPNFSSANSGSTNGDPRAEIFRDGSNRVLAKVSLILEQEPCGRDVAMAALKRALTFDQFLLSARR